MTRPLHVPAGRGPGCCALTMAVALTFAAPLPGARAATPAEAIAALGAQRAASGIPADVVEDPRWSAGCAAHVAWMRQNDTLAHDETPGTPGYSPQGDAAGNASVLSGASGLPLPRWWAGGADPFSDAPFHLLQLLNPALSVTGYADDAADGRAFLCMNTLAGRTRRPPAGATLYASPGDGATVDPALTVTGESPGSPGDYVGLPQSPPTTTGPNILLYGFGRDAGDEMRVISRSLTGPDGPVADVRVLDYATRPGPVAGDPADALRPAGASAILIPARPLVPGSAYTATVGVMLSTGGGPPFVPASRSWTFHTGGTAPAGGARAPQAATAPGTAAPRRAGVTFIGPVRATGGTTLQVTLLGGRAVGMTAMLWAQELTRACPRAVRWRRCRVRPAGRVTQRTLRLRSRQKVTVPRTPAGVRLTVRVGAFALGTRRYAATRLSRDVR